MDANLARRIAVAAVGVPAALLFAWWGGWPFALLLALIAVLGVSEMFTLARARALRPSALLGFPAAAAFAPAAWLFASAPGFRDAATGWWPFAAALWLMAILTWALAARGPAGHPLAAAGVTLLAPLYAGALPAFLVSIRHQAYGTGSWPGAWLVFFPLVVTWVCDSFAMFGGRLFKGPKLAPVVSPGKTRSGSLSGVAGALLVAVVFWRFVFPPMGIGLPLGAALAIAAALSVVGQVGDLVESLFKREAGLKDSGALIPGHGGVLDRLDSLYFVIPVAALLYRAFGII